MKCGIVNLIKEDWHILTCQFEYWSHLRENFIRWHVMAFVGCLLLCFISPFLGLGSVLCLISWCYLVLFDKKRRIYKDGYLPKCYEFIGTIWATLVIGGVIADLIFSSSEFVS